ncbi:endonuclease/exonuclease/phosphatase family protein [Umezawaea sp.]|uniref:endonuclease/exonuclease/phosphatase family protein n=1 Tax=Umezawaea sp. TaxID=1955258 RepID=UPI002ED0959E
MAVTDPPRRRARSVVLGACAVVLAGVAALLLVRATGLDAGTVFSAVVVGVPYAAVVTAVVAVVLAVAGARWPGGIALVLLVVQVVWLAPRFTSDGVEVPADAPRLRVATINAHLGGVDPRALVDFVRAERVDVLAVEELPPEAIPALDDAGLRELMPHRELRPRDDSSLYSRLPFTASGPLAAPTTWPQTTATVDVNGRAVRFVAVHTYYPTGDPGLWAADLTALRASAGEDSVLLGDFNATLDHALMRDLLSAGLVDAHAELGNGWAPTWPADSVLPPVVQLDHVLHGRGLAAVRTDERTLPGSDHRLVFAELALL